MTVNALWRKLQQLELEHGPKTPVVFDLTTVETGNGCWSVNDIKGLRVEFVHAMDGDGGTIENKDGTERGRISVILEGQNN